MTAGGVLLWTAGRSARMPAALPHLVGVRGQVRPVAAIEAIPENGGRRDRIGRLGLAARGVVAAPIVGGSDTGGETREAAAIETLVGNASAQRPVVVALVAPEVLAQDAWRHDVWSGRPVDHPMPTTAVDGGHERLRALLDGRRHVRTVTCGADALAGQDRPPWWGLTDRGMEVLRRMNAHAVDDRERQLFRDVVTGTFAV